MKKLYLILLFVFLNLSVSARDFHLLILGDTTDQHIRMGVKEDMRRIEARFAKIAQNSKATLRTTLLNGEKLRRQNIETWIANEPIHSNDVVIFYYSGHGFRKWTDSSIWPRGSLPLQNEQVNFCHIMKKLFDKSAAFYLIIFDCCNDTPDAEAPKKKGMHSPHLLSSGCKKLFLDTHGFVIIAAASPGEIADAPPDGSILTKSFLKTLCNTIKTGPAKWTEILEKTKESSQRHSLYAQTTKYIISLSPAKRRSQENKTLFNTEKVYRGETYENTP